jgi:hypothetical protein
MTVLPFIGVHPKLFPVHRETDFDVFPQPWIKQQSVKFITHFRIVRSYGIDGAVLFTVCAFQAWRLRFRLSFAFIVVSCLLFSHEKGKYGDFYCKNI